MDNLKLGYGGTQAEMERLLAKAEELTGVHYELGNFGDMVAAIHEVQASMGITGTTAKEAATTIEGSTASMRAAWANLATGIGDDTADLGLLLDQFVAATRTAGDNILKRLQVIGQQLGEVVAGIAPLIAQALPTLLSTVLPMLIQTGGQLLAGIVQGLAASAPSVLDTLTGAAVQLIDSLAQGIQDNFPALADQGLQALVQFTGGIRQNAGRLVDSGLALIKALAQGIADSLPSLIENIPQIVINIAGIINDNAPKILAAGVEIILTLIKGIVQALPTLAQNIPQIAEAIFSAWQAISWINLGTKLIQGLTGGIKNALSSVSSAIKDLGAHVKDAFLHHKWADLGRYVVEGLVNGIKNGVQNAVDAVKNLGTTIINTAKGILGIHSPSKVMADEVGVYIPAGIAEGIESNAQAAVDAAKAVAEDCAEVAQDAVKSFNDLSTELAQLAQDGPIGYLQQLWTAVQNQDWLGIGSFIARTIYDGMSADSKAALADTVLGWVQAINDAYTGEGYAGVLRTGKQIGSDLISALRDGAQSIAPQVLQLVSGLSTQIQTTIQSLVTAAKVGGAAIGQGLHAGIAGMMGSIVSAVMGMAASIGSALLAVISAVIATLAALGPLGWVLGIAGALAGLYAAKKLAEALGGSSSSSSSSSGGSGSSGSSGKWDAAATVPDTAKDVVAAVQEATKATEESTKAANELAQSLLSEARALVLSDQMQLGSRVAASRHEQLAGYAAGYAGGSQVTIHQEIKAVPQTAADLARTSRVEAERAVRQGR